MAICTPVIRTLDSLVVSGSLMVILSSSAISSAVMGSGIVSGFFRNSTTV